MIIAECTSTEFLGRWSGVIRVRTPHLPVNRAALPPQPRNPEDPGDYGPAPSHNEVHIAALQRGATRLRTKYPDIHDSEPVPSLVSLSDGRQSLGETPTVHLLSLLLYTRKADPTHLTAVPGRLMFLGGAR